MWWIRMTLYRKNIDEKLIGEYGLGYIYVFHIWGGQCVDVTGEADRQDDWFWKAS